MFRKSIVLVNRGVERKSTIERAGKGPYGTKTLKMFERVFLGWFCMYPSLPATVSGVSRLVFDVATRNVRFWRQREQKLQRLYDRDAVVPKARRCPPAAPNDYKRKYMPGEAKLVVDMQGVTDGLVGAALKKHEPKVKRCGVALKNGKLCPRPVRRAECRTHGPTREIRKLADKCRRDLGLCESKATASRTTVADLVRVLNAMPGAVSARRKSRPDLYGPDSAVLAFALCCKLANLLDAQGVDGLVQGLPDIDYDEVTALSFFCAEDVQAFAATGAAGAGRWHAAREFLGQEHNRMHDRTVPEWEGGPDELCRVDVYVKYPGVFRGLKLGVLKHFWTCPALTWQSLAKLVYNFSVRADWRTDKEHHERMAQDLACFRSWRWSPGKWGGRCGAEEVEEMLEVMPQWFDNNAPSLLVLVRAFCRALSAQRKNARGEGVFRGEWVYDEDAHVADKSLLRRYPWHVPGTPVRAAASPDAAFARAKDAPIFYAGIDAVSRNGDPRNQQMHPVSCDVTVFWEYTAAPSDGDDHYRVYVGLWQRDAYNSCKSSLSIAALCSVVYHGNLFSSAEDKEQKAKALGAKLAARVALGSSEARMTDGQFAAVLSALPKCAASLGKGGPGGGFEAVVDFCAFLRQNVAYGRGGSGAPLVWTHEASPCTWGVGEHCVLEVEWGRNQWDRNSVVGIGTWHRDPASASRTWAGLVDMCVVVATGRRFESPNEKDALTQTLLSRGEAQWASGACSYEAMAAMLEQAPGMFAGPPWQRKLVRAFCRFLHMDLVCAGSLFSGCVAYNEKLSLAEQRGQPVARDVFQTGPVGPVTIHLKTPERPSPNARELPVLGEWPYDPKSLRATAEGLAYLCHTVARRNVFKSPGHRRCAVRGVARAALAQLFAERDARSDCGLRDLRRLVCPSSGLAALFADRDDRFLAQCLCGFLSSELERGWPFQTSTGPVVVYDEPACVRCAADWLAQRPFRLETQYRTGFSATLSWELPHDEWQTPRTGVRTNNVLGELVFAEDSFGRTWASLVRCCFAVATFNNRHPSEQQWARASKHAVAAATMLRWLGEELGDAELSAGRDRPCSDEDLLAMFWHAPALLLRLGLFRASGHVLACALCGWLARQQNTPAGVRSVHAEYPEAKALRALPSWPGERSEERELFALIRKERRFPPQLPVSPDLEYVYVPGRSPSVFNVQVWWKGGDRHAAEAADRLGLFEKLQIGYFRYYPLSVELTWASLVRCCHAISRAGDFPSGAAARHARAEREREMVQRSLQKLGETRDRVCAFWQWPWKPSVIGHISLDDLRANAADFGRHLQRAPDVLSDCFEGVGLKAVRAFCKWLFGVCAEKTCFDELEESHLGKTSNGLVYDEVQALRDLDDWDDSMFAEMRQKRPFSYQFETPPYVSK